MADVADFGTGACQRSGIIQVDGNGFPDVTRHAVDNERVPTDLLGHEIELEAASGRRVGEQAGVVLDRVEVDYECARGNETAAVHIERRVDQRAVPAG